jgi:hypothetical protein
MHPLDRTRTIVNAKKLLTILISITLLFGFSTQKAQSQGSIQFKSVTVSLYPEFHQSSVYVTSELVLADNLLLPQTLTLQIPAEIDDFIVTYLDEDGFIASPDLTVTRDLHWKYIRFLSPSPTIRVEYHDLRLAQEGNSRSFDFEWLSSYPVFTFTIQVFQPEGISQFESNRTLESTHQENSNLIMSSLDQRPLPAETLFELSFSYLSSGDITYPNQQVEVREEISNSTQGRVPQPISLVFWLSSIALSILILVVSYFIWVKRRTSQQRGRIVQGVGLMNPEKMAVFCHECGMRSSPGDSYCSNCGTELRKPTTFIGSHH